MNHTLEPAPPWEQLGISEEQFNQRKSKVSVLVSDTADGNYVPVDASTSIKAAKPERKTITVDLTDMPEVYARIKQLAEADDRTMSNWMKRYLRKEHDAVVGK